MWSARAHIYNCLLVMLFTSIFMNWVASISTTRALSFFICELHTKHLIYYLFIWRPPFFLFVINKHFLFFLVNMQRHYFIYWISFCMCMFAGKVIPSHTLIEYSNSAIHSIYNDVGVRMSEQLSMGCVCAW